MHRPFERAAASENAYEVESWFQYDWKPLSAEEIEHALKLLSWSRTDLLKIIDALRKLPSYQTNASAMRFLDLVEVHEGRSDRLR